MGRQTVAIAVGGPLFPNCRKLGEMSFLAWIVLGLIAGFIGSKIVNRQGEGLFLDIVLGIVGAVAGGWLFNTFGASGVTGLNLYSLLVAVVGAVVLLVIYHAVRRTVTAGRTAQFVYPVKVCELITHIKRFAGTKQLVRDFGLVPIC